MKNCFSCGTGATHRYEWPWGENGYTCPDHIADLRGTASRLKRDVEIIPLDFGAAVVPPTSTDETRDLRKAVIELSHQLEEEKRANAELRDQIVRLRSELEQPEQLEQTEQPESVIEGEPTAPT